MRKEGDIPIQNEEYITHLELSGNIYNVLHEIYNEIKSRKGRYRENNGKEREVDSNNSSSSESKCEISWIRKYNEGESNNKGDGRVKEKNNKVENGMICVVTSKKPRIYTRKTKKRENKKGGREERRRNNCM